MLTREMILHLALSDREHIEHCIEVAQEAIAASSGCGGCPVTLTAAQLGPLTSAAADALELLQHAYEMLPVLDALREVTPAIGKLAVALNSARTRGEQAIAAAERDEMATAKRLGWTATAGGGR